MSDELTREQFEETLWAAVNVLDDDGPSYNKILAHDLALRAQLAACQESCDELRKDRDLAWHQCEEWRKSDEAIRGVYARLLKEHELKQHEVEALTAKLAAMEKQIKDYEAEDGPTYKELCLTNVETIKDLQQQLQTAREQQARLREALRTVLKHLNTCLDDRDIDPDGPIDELYGMMHEWEDLVAQATPTGNAFDARAAVVELAETVEASDRLRRLPLAGDVQRAVELKRKAKG